MRGTPRSGCLKILLIEQLVFTPDVSWINPYEKRRRISRYGEFDAQGRCRGRQ